MAVVTVSRLGKDICIKIPARIAASLGISESYDEEVSIASERRMAHNLSSIFDVPVSRFI